MPLKLLFQVTPPLIALCNFICVTTVFYTEIIYCRTLQRNYNLQRWTSSRQDVGDVVPILTPASDLAVDAISASAAVNSYLPDLGFWADLGDLMLSGSSLSPMARLSRDVFESQECAEYFSCEVSRFSRMHSPLRFMHTFLQDLPFRGDLADRVKMGSTRSTKVNKCGFDCSPIQYLNRGVKTLSLLHSVAKVANPATDLRDI